MQFLSKITDLTSKRKCFGILTTSSLLLLVTINNLIKVNKLMASQDSYYALVQLLIGLYLLGCTIANMTRAALIDTTINSIELQIKQLPEWKYCSHCEQYAPPRSYHCYTCDKCILKRHNHCLFLDKCVGHRNMRFYLLFILFVWFGAVYSTNLNADHYVRVFNEFSLKSIMVTVVPWLAWGIGMIGLVELFFIFVNSITLIMSFLMFFYFLINLRMILNGQTWHENAKKIKIYKLGWYENLKEAVGTNWLLCILNPFARLSLLSDGISFRKSTIFQFEQTDTRYMGNSINTMAYTQQQHQNLNTFTKRRVI